MRLLEWFTVKDAAKYLSIILGEEVTEAHILRLALDGQLTLSVNFVNKVTACPGGKFLPFQEWEEDFRKGVSISELKAGARTVLPGGDLSFHAPGYCFIPAPRGMKENVFRKLTKKEQEKVIRLAIDEAVHNAELIAKEFGGKVPPDWFNRRVETISGVWDLPMIGGERLDVEHQYQSMTDGPEVTLISLDGTFVADQDGKIWQLQDQLDMKEPCQAATNATTGDNERDNHKKRVKKPCDDSDNYYPAGGLPSDSVLVVRTSALREFEEQIRTEYAGDEKPPSERKERSDLHIIAALLQIIMDERLFSSEEKLREQIADEYRDFEGCAERTLAGRFAEAKKLISNPK
jgi:hypothetical protein